MMMVSHWTMSGHQSAFAIYCWHWLGSHHHFSILNGQQNMRMKETSLDVQLSKSMSEKRKRDESNNMMAHKRCFSHF